jgi:transcriptional regulator GlxA family with amidase domain
MRVRYLVRAGLGVLALSLVGFAIWLASLPGPTPSPGVAALPQAERAQILAALAPPKRLRPRVAVLAINDATEVTDYVVPTGVLRRADVADVVMLATQPGAVTLFPALRVQPDATIADFDYRYPDGADYVIVPAMSRDDDPAALAWIQAQARKGATIIGICAGAKVVAAAGLLEGKRATTHWYYLDALRKRSPGLRYVADRRLVVDAGVATTTGITASLPAMLMLVEAIGGRDKADAVAMELGLRTRDLGHDSQTFRFTRPFALTVMGNTLAFWNREQLGVPLQPGMDEVWLALVADAWSRTYRSQALSYAPTAAPVQTLHGIRIVPDRVAAEWAAAARVPALADQKPAAALDQTLLAITARYGKATTDVVAMQLEYPRP